MKIFTNVRWILLLSFVSCQAIVFDVSLNEQSKEIFESKIEAFKNAKLLQENNENNAAIIQYCDHLKDEGLESLQNNAKIVRIAQILLIKNVLLKNEALLKKTFNMDKSVINEWVSAKLVEFSSGEILAGQFLLIARMKDFIANLSHFLKKEKIS